MWESSWMRSGTTTYCYDRHGNVIQKTQNTGGTVLVTQSTYTVADRLASMTYPSGSTVTYGRDALGRVQTVSWKPAGARSIGLVKSATWYPFGPLNTLTFGNGRTQSRTYDQDYAIDAISGTPAGALTLDLGVDVMGNITNASSTLSPTTPDRGYLYDPLYRLTAAQTGTLPPTPLEAYTYNKTGDRLSAALNGGAAQAYTYTPLTHHLASVGGTARTYDLNGNTQTGTATGLTLGYDARNRLSTAVQGNASANYGYNGRGERVSKQYQPPLGQVTTTAYAYDEAGRLLGDYATATSPQAEYVYLDSTPIAVVKAGVPYYIEADHLGTPRQVIDATRNMAVWKWDSLASTFGTNAPNQDPDGDSTQFVMNLKFPGQYYDAETGLNYNYFRDYEAGTGRYVESDPIGLNGGVSVYAYTRSSPMRRIDRLGLLEIDPSCNYCDKDGDVEERMRENASIACTEKIKMIKNGVLTECILKRCLSNSKVICNGVSCTPGVGGYNEWAGVVSSAFVSPGIFIPSPDVHICVPSTSWSRRATNILHELAHSCAWDHGNGDGVPHDPNPQPWPRY